MAGMTGDIEILVTVRLYDADPAEVVTRMRTMPDDVPWYVSADGAGEFEIIRIAVLEQDKTETDLFRVITVLMRQVCTSDVVIPAIALALARPAVVSPDDAGLRLTIPGAETAAAVVAGTEETDLAALITATAGEYFASPLPFAVLLARGVLAAGYRKVSS
jgi:hypothetical protein